MISIDIPQVTMGIRKWPWPWQWFGVPSGNPKYRLLRTGPKPGIRNRPSQNPIRIDFFVGQTSRYVRRTHLRKKKSAASDLCIWQNWKIISRIRNMANSPIVDVESLVRLKRRSWLAFVRREWLRSGWLWCVAIPKMDCWPIPFQQVSRTLLLTINQKTYRCLTLLKWGLTWF